MERQTVNRTHTVRQSARLALMHMWLVKDVDWPALSQPLALLLRPVFADVILTFKHARLGQTNGEGRTCIKV